MPPLTVPPPKPGVVSTPNVGALPGANTAPVLNAQGQVIPPKAVYPWHTMDPTSEEWVQRIMLFYGPSGCGKTYSAGQLPSPLILGCDPGALGGALSAQKFGPKLMKIKSYQEVMNVLPLLKQAAIEKEFDVLVLDSLSYMAKMVMHAILAPLGREIPRFEEWNLNAERIRRLINNLVDIPAHIVFTCVDDMSKDETSGKVWGGPSLPGKLSKELPQACDVVLRLFTQTSYGADGKLQVLYKFRSVPDDVWFAKDRTRLLPSEGIMSYDVLKPLFTRVK
jgi:hypothetical protein